MAGARLLIQPVRDVAVVNFSDASILDALQVQQIGEELYDLVETRARRKVILDFSNVRFLSSAALGVLINLRKKADGIKGKVMLCCIRPEIHRVFKLTNLDKLFEIYDSEEKALNAFGVTTVG